MTSEADIEDAFVDYVESLGGEALKLALKGVRGFPDRTVLIGGQAFFFEFKKPGGGDVSPQQTKWKDDLMGLGFRSVIVDNLDEAKKLLNQFIEGK